MAELNLRYELRAYENTNCCRLASYILALAPEPQETLERDAVIAHWAERYPRHAAPGAGKTIRNRVGSAISLLNTAGMTQTAERQTIAIIDRSRLSMAAGNLAIVEDDQGMAVRPGLWVARPSVPEHLLEVQATLEALRVQTLQTE